jgi:hypothetical protein
MKPLFLSKSQTYEFVQTTCANKFWDIWDIFGQFNITDFGTVSILSIFFINPYYFYKKISLNAKLYIPSTLNIDHILWHSQLIVCAENVKSWFKSWVFSFHFSSLYPAP